MKFIREDYVQKKQRRNRSIAYLFLLTLVLVLFSYILFKKSPVETEIGQSAQVQPAQTDTQTEAAKPAAAQKTPTGPAAAGVGNVNLPALIEKTRKSVALIKIYDSKDTLLGQGSGFFIDGTHMVSNRHVFADAMKAEVQTSKGKLQVKKVLSEHSDYDMVKLEIDTKKQPIKPLTINEALPKVGEAVVVIGNPLGLESTASNGIVSAIRDRKPHGKVIQITCPISPGSSGSPVINMKGEVIGVATFNIGGQEGGQNLNFAIPIARLKDLNPIENGELASINFSDPDLVKAMDNPFDQGMLLYTRQEYAGAIAFFEKATEEDPNNAEAFVYLGICYRETKATNAVNAFKSAVKINPEYAEAYCQLGITYVRLNMQTEAIKALREALRINPDYDEALLNLGIAFYSGKKYSEAIKVLGRSTDIYPTSLGYYYKGASHFSLGQHGRAIQALRLSIEMDPDDIEPYIVLAGAYAYEENWTRGIEIMNKAVILDPMRPEVHFYLGILHLGNDDLPSAQYEYDALRRLKGSKKLQSELARAINQYKYSRRR